MNSKKRIALKSSKGFTFVEMMVVIFIFAVVSAILLFRYSDFSTSISLRNLSQEVALSIRKAQTLATSVRGGSPADAYNASKGYGLYFNLSNYNIKYGGGDSSFVIFRDENGDMLYTQNGETCGTPTMIDECLEKFAITTGDKINTICVETTCSTPSIGGATIYFRRPNPDAKIFFEAGRIERSYADIELISKKGAKKTVRVWNTGQIGVLP